MSWIAPIARALLKSREGDEVKLQTPGGMEVLEAPERTEAETAGSAEAHATPARWLLSAAKSEAGESRLIAVALPGGPAPAQRLTVQMAPASGTAFGPKASAADSLTAIAVKQMEEQLGKARQEIAIVAGRLCGVVEQARADDAGRGLRAHQR